MSRIAVFPGVFDPPTLGHQDIIEKALLLFDKLIVAIAENPNKNTLFTLDERLEMLELLYIEKSQVEIASFSGLSAEFAVSKGSHFLVRGLRSIADFEKESQMAFMNRQIAKVETLFFFADRAQISSSLIREIAAFNGPLQDLVSPEIERKLQEKKMR